MSMLCPRHRPGRMPVRRSLSPYRRCVLALLLATGIASPAHAGEVTRVLVMPAPHAATGRDGVARFVSRLEAVAGTRFELNGINRTGALALTPASRQDAVALRARLRQERSVLWVNDAPPAASSQRAQAKAARFAERGQKLMVRLADGIVPDWSVLAPRFAGLLGVDVAAERSIGSVWVLRLATPQSAPQLIDLATLLQTDPVVRYADPVLRRYTQAQVPTPNDPFFTRQWNLTDAASGIDIFAAWALQRGSVPITVAVVDTGILPHPDLAGVVLPGHDFISDPGRARDGDGRDADPADEGDWLAAGDCGGYPARDSTWHGTFVAGLIAATPNNGEGIAGINANARILPVRALGQCGGTDEDVFAAMLWAAGAPVAGAPPNPNPAKVINLSLGGFGACAQSIQEAVDDALAHGAIVVAAAGNASDDVASFAPANCGGVITVGAHNRMGERAFYSNFGRRIDISAPSGDGRGDDSAFSLSNSGTTVPGMPTYRDGIGTSFSAPMVAGTVSLMLGRNPMLTTGRALEILQNTTRNFIAGSPCRLGNLCGVGMLDAGLAMASTVPGTEAAPPNTVAVVEYYDAARDHYFMTANAAEIAALDAPGGAFARTGYLFYAYVDPSLAPPGASPVCRFYASAQVQIDSHWFSADPAQCAFVQQRWAGVWMLEDPATFYVVLPGAGGTCPDSTLPVYRYFNGRRDASQRYTVDLSVTRTMVNRAWVPDGPGPNGTVFCAPI